MLPYNKKIEDYNGTKEKCYLCPTYFNNGYVYIQNVFPKDSDIKYEYIETRLKYFVCNECNKDENKNKQIDEDMTHWVSVQKGFPGYSSEIDNKSEDLVKNKDNIDNVPEPV